jgi:hypothetical protein
MIPLQMIMLRLVPFACIHTQTPRSMFAKGCSQYGSRNCNSFVLNISFQVVSSAMFVYTPCPSAHARGKSRDITAWYTIITSGSPTSQSLCIFMYVWMYVSVSQYSRSPGRDMNRGCPQYEAGVLTTQPRRSVCIDSGFDSPSALTAHGYLT